MDYSKDTARKQREELQHLGGPAEDLLSNFTFPSIESDTGASQLGDNFFFNKNSRAVSLKGSELLKEDNPAKSIELAAELR